MKQTLNEKKISYIIWRNYSKPEGDQIQFFFQRQKKTAAESKDINSLPELPYGLLFIHANSFEQREFNRNFTSKWHFFQTCAIRLEARYRFEMSGI